MAMALDETSDVDRCRAQPRPRRLTLEQGVARTRTGVLGRLRSHPERPHRRGNLGGGRGGAHRRRRRRGRWPARVVERARDRRDVQDARRGRQRGVARPVRAARPDTVAARPGAGRAGGRARRRRQRHRQDHDRGQARPSLRARAEPRCFWPRPTHSARRPSSSSRRGRDRAKLPLVAHQAGADPSAVVYDALDAAAARGSDVVVVDTAGRLHTKSNLMEELAKIRRTIGKRLPDAQPEVLFVLDATTGQNGLTQARSFHESAPLSGVVLTKLDTTSRGGIAFAIEDALNVPVLFVGVGEKLEDLLDFQPNTFVDALLAYVRPRVGRSSSIVRILRTGENHSASTAARSPTDRAEEQLSRAVRSRGPGSPRRALPRAGPVSTATLTVAFTRPSWRSWTIDCRIEVSAMSKAVIAGSVTSCWPTRNAIAISGAPAGASGMKRLPRPPMSRPLTITIGPTPRPPCQPGGENRPERAS